MVFANRKAKKRSGLAHLNEEIKRLLLLGKEFEYGCQGNRDFFREDVSSS